MSATIKDIAEAAGVSAATVSRVLANKEGFYSQATATRVRKIAVSLDYEKNTSAVELVTRKSRVIGVIISATKTNFSDKIIEGIHAEAIRHGLSVIMLYAGQNDPQLQEQALRTLIERAVKGILVVAIQLADENLALLQASQIPYRFLSTSYNSNKLPSIASDDYQIGYQATQHLIERGHHKIGLVAMDTSGHIGQQRVAGYKAAMIQAALSIEDDWIKEGMYTYEDGVRAMQTFGRQPEVTAIIGASDLAAIGVLNQAMQYGIQVPKQLAIISIDGTYLARIVRPQLTTVTQAFYEMGTLGTQMLLDQTQQTVSQFTPIKIETRQST
ncbi:LacI family DNA-binding transcriptional regulator [Secundilactobacillus hailunensis]|uniref:LacI family DNA-binding transcriptional regulator n=1 Tax=Secundilactobacillus hailunensis TaxID=2559923 RepID=A0ABW1TEB1_9LACO|nr:LacI family DNA-binding transcriptional regulator [Secundilactobacillus hailunensis]